MSARLKVIIAVIIGAVSVASQLAFDPDAIAHLETGSVLVRQGVVFGTAAVAAAVAWVTVHRRVDAASASANAFLGAVTVVGGSLMVADIVAGTA